VQGRLDYQQRLEKAKAQEKHDQARKKLDEVKAAGEDHWQALKAGVEGAWRELRKSVDSAKLE
jgi:hypothetical protein